jgi:hypothetical protein
VEVINHGTEPRTSDYYFRRVASSVEKLKLIDVNVMGFITDNEATMRSLRTKIVAQYPQSIDVGDPPHALQLIVKDILSSETYTALVVEVNLVTDKFKNTRLKQFLKALVLQNNDQHIGLKKGVITRWGTNYKQFKKIFISKNSILSVLADPNAAPYISRFSFN